MLPAFKLLVSPRPLVIGHRGICQNAPENTLPSFERALDAGCDLVELDYRHTRDAQPIVIHDASLARTTDARRRWRSRRLAVRSRTASEITALDAGAWFHQKYRGTRVPLLREALDLIHARGVALIERKTGDALTLARLLGRNQWINRVVVQAFDWSYLRDLNRLEPDQLLGALGPPTRLANGRKPGLRGRGLNRKWLDELQKSGARVAVWNHHVSRAAVRDAHRRGLKVWVYTVNDARKAKRLFNLGVDGLISNRPPVILQALAFRDGGKDF